MKTPSHLEHIDPQLWPAVATVPTMGLLRGPQAKKEEAHLARTFDAAGLTVGLDGDLVVHSDALFYRIAEAGWLGLGESYMAGEWDATDLGSVLRKLIAVGYQPKRRLTVKPVGKKRARARRPFDAVADADDVMGIPHELRSLFSGDGASCAVGIFNSGIPTTLHPTSTTESTSISAPGSVEAADIGEAQQRACTTLCQSLDIRSGDLVGEFGFNGAAISATARSLGARASYFSADALNVEKVRAMRLPGVDVTRIPFPVPHEGHAARRFTAVVTGDYANFLPVNSFQAFARWARHNVSPVGAMGVAALVSIGQENPTDHVLQLFRDYLAPTFTLPAAQALPGLLVQETGMPLRSCVDYDSHVAPSFRASRTNFEVAGAQAAAMGFDSCYRRLVQFSLASMEALAQEKYVGVRQVVVGS